MPAHGHRPIFAQWQRREYVGFYSMINSGLENMNGIRMLGVSLLCSVACSAQEFCCKNVCKSAGVLMETAFPQPLLAATAWAHTVSNNRENASRFSFSS